MTIHDDLLAFHAAMGVPAFTAPAVPPTERVQLRARILAEESVVEHLRAIGADEELVLQAEEAIERAVMSARRESTNIVLVADAMADTIYVAAGTNLEYGIPGHEVFQEVHRANMRKANGPRREDGKVLKPKGWQGPQIERVLREAGWRG